VGGDFFGGMTLADGTSTLFLGDVSGHGLAAAMCAGGVTTHTRYLAAQGLPPGPVLQELQRSLIRPLEAMELYVTLCVCRLDPRRGRIECASAGHPWPIAIDTEGATSLEGVPGAPIGLFPDAAYPETSHQVDSRTILAFLSDGLTEHCHDPNPLRALRSALGPPTQTWDPAMAARTITEMLPLGDSAPPPDDCTLVLTRWHE
jgi:serine phosphatase RsbU (regulator of sigma subunit)